MRHDDYYTDDTLAPRRAVRKNLEPQNLHTCSTCAVRATTGRLELGYNVL